MAKGASAMRPAVGTMNGYGIQQAAARALLRIDGHHNFPPLSKLL